MKKILYSIIIIVCLTGAWHMGYSQANAGLKSVLTADSLASGNYKDVLTSFFRLSLKDLTGPDKKVNFTSNLFGIMLKQNPNLLIDTNYKKYTAVRNTNISLGLALDSSNNFNGASLELKYALINMRDYTVAHKYIPQQMKALATLHKLHRDVSREISRLPDSLKTKYLHQLNSFTNDTATGLVELDAGLQVIIQRNLVDTSLLKAFKNNPSLSYRQLALNKMKPIKDSYQNMPLLTLAVNTKTYPDKFQLSDANANLEFLKGIVNPKALINIEFNAIANYRFTHDSTMITRNLDRQLFSVEGGLNFVMKGWGVDQTFLELKLSFSDTYVTTPRRILADQEGAPFELKNSPSINGTLRIRISNDIWIPIEIKYDTNTHSVLGLFNITSSFTALGLRGKS